jgi:hypothetical protein
MDVANCFIHKNVRNTVFAKMAFKKKKKCGLTALHYTIHFDVRTETCPLSVSQLAAHMTVYGGHSTEKCKHVPHQCSTQKSIQDSSLFSLET